MLFKLFKEFVYFIYTGLDNEDKKEILKNIGPENWDNFWIHSSLTDDIDFAQQYDNDKYKIFLSINKEDGPIYEILDHFIFIAERVEKIECKYENRPEFMQKLEVLNNET